MNSTAFQTRMFGGAGVQFLKTYEYVKKAGVDAKKFDMHTDKLENFDVFHNFEMNRDTWNIFSMAKEEGMGLAVSSVYWPPVNVFKSDEKMKDLGKLIFEKFANFWPSQFNPFFIAYPYKGFLNKADIILPNSLMEARTIAKRFGIPIKKFHVVPNGVDKKFINAKPDLFIKKYKMRDFVLFVGRIDPRKNILRMIRAVKKLKLKTVIIGHTSPKLQYYLEMCKKEAEGADIHFLGSFPAESEILMSAYAAAKTFVLPSWFETPGLVALEAGLAGCNVAISSGGSTTEYFDKYAEYCDPSDQTSIERAIENAHKKYKNNSLKNHILKNFTWEIVAKRTIEAYKKTAYI